MGSPRRSAAEAWAYSWREIAMISPRAVKRNTRGLENRVESMRCSIAYRGELRSVIRYRGCGGLHRKVCLGGRGLRYWLGLERWRRENIPDDQLPKLVENLVSNLCQEAKLVRPDRSTRTVEIEGEDEHQAGE